MCGIAGFCNSTNNWESEIQKMNNRMFHRGPDAGDYYRTDAGEVVLGHRRLAIVDLTPAGAQPFISQSGRYVMVYNGEIYNHRDLKKEFLTKNPDFNFKGSSDTEVLIEAFEVYGVEETIKKCKGMFAIALYDKEEKELTLIRDRVGEKPLYYGFVNDRFVFASDLGSIRVLSDFNNQVDRQVLRAYFTYGYIPAPYSIYEGINKLEPGTILKIKAPFSKEDINTTCYWSMKNVASVGQSNIFSGSFEEASIELENKLKDALKDQMVADVPVGAFLSAGIDSSTIVSLMQEVAGSKKVHTYTIGMEDKEFNEAKIASEIAGIIGTEHTQMYISEEDAKAVIPLLPAMFAEPFGDSSQIPTYLVSKMTRQHVTVSLSGDAGDELFCGYNVYANVERIWSKAKNRPLWARNIVSNVINISPLSSNPTWRNRALFLKAKSVEDVYEWEYKEDDFVKQIAKEKESYPDKLTCYERGFLEDENSNMMLMDLTMYHPDDILVKVDRTAMAVSLETRVPLLDRDVVEYAWRLPIEFKRKDGVSKRILKDILYKRLPKELMERPKKGFGIPIARWLRETNLRDWAEDLLSPDKIRKQGYLNEEVVTGLWKDFIDNNNWVPQIWYILMFQAWVQYNDNE